MQLKEIGKYYDIIEKFSGNGLVGNATIESLSDSIFNPEELNSFLDVINKYKELGSDAESVNVLLTNSFDKLTGAQILEKIAVTDLNDAQKLQLIQDYAIDGANYETVESIVAVTAAETAETGATVGLSTAFKGLATSMKAFATSIPGILAIITAVGYGAYKLFDLLTVSYEEHLEKLEEAKQAYTDAESEVESLQGQLDELNSKIEEINNQDTLSLSDEQDLKNLVAETKELQRQLNIAKERAKFEGRKAEREAIDTLNSKQVSNYKKGMSETGEETVSLTTSREELKEAINAYDRIKDAVDDYQAQIDNLESSGIFEGDQYDKINKNLEYHKQLLDETGLNITNLADELRGQSDSLIGATEEGNKLKLSVEESLQAYDEWHNRINNVSEAFDTLSESEQKQVLINKLADKGYDYEKIAKIVSDLSSDASKTISDNFSDFEKQIDEVSGKSSDINVLSNSISRFVAETSKLKDDNITRLSLSESLGDIKSFKTEIENTTTAISALTTAVSEQYTQNYITQESYDALIDANSQFAECIEFGNGYMRLNVQQANELTKANAELKLSELDLKEALEVEQYNKNIEALKQLGDSDDELRAKLEAENSKIEENVRQYDLLEAQLLGVTSAYNDWIASQSAPDVGDQYDKMVSDYKKVEELYQKGLTGDAEFQAFNKLIGGENAVTANFEKNLETFKRYFSETEVGINNFIDDIVRVNNLELNADGLYDGVVDWQKTMQELGLTHDEMQSLFDKLEQYEFHVDTTSGIDGLDNLKEHQSELNAEIENYRENIEKAKAQGIDTTDAENSLSSLQERYASITDEIAKMKDEASDGTITLDIDAELAQLDLSNISQEAQETLNKLKADNDQLKLSVQMGVDDTSYLEGKVKADLALLKEQLKVPVEADSDTANKSIKELTQTATDFDKVINQAKTDTQNLGTTHISDLGFNSLNSSIGNVNTSVSTLQRNLDTIASKTYTLKVTTSQEGKGKLLGTTGGFAFANGSGITAQESSLSLTGELGRELVVRGDRWFTVGDNGAEFVHIKKGDIVFNADQTSQLLNGSGKINSRGTALSGGTAYVGKNRKESSKTATSVKGLSHVKTISTTTGDSAGKNNNNNKDNTDKTTKKTKQLVDWIERRINVLTIKAERWSNIIEKATNPNRVDSYYKKLDSITQKQVKTYGDAYNRYMSKANTVKLSQGLKNKVQSKDTALFDKNGNLKSQKELIKKYDEKTYNRIQDYQNWYDKAISAIDEFTESSYKLANSPLEKAADKIDLLSKSMEVLDARLDASSIDDYKSANNIINKQMTNSASQNEANKNALLTAQSKIDAVKGISYEDLIKNGEKLEEVDLSLYKLGSKQYKQAVQYNANVTAYNNALVEAQKSENELIKQNIEYRKQQFDNIEEYYNKQVELTQMREDSISREADLIETKGMTVNKKYYEDQIGYEKQKKAKLQESKAELEAQLALIPQGTSEWYDANKALDDVKASIDDCTKSAFAFYNQIREIADALHDKIRDELSYIQSDIETLAKTWEKYDLFNEETGLITKEGLATLGTYISGMTTAAAKRKADTEVLEQLEKKFEELPDKWEAANENEIITIDGRPYASKEQLYYNGVLEYRNKLQQDFVEQIEAENNAIDLAIKKYEAEANVLKRITEEKKNSLNYEKELYNWQKQVQEATKGIGSLQKQIAALQGDNSEEGVMRRQKLQSQLDDAQQNLQDQEREKYISDMSDMLDRMYEEYESVLDKETKNRDALLSKIVTVGENTIDTIKNTMETYASKYDYSDFKVIETAISAMKIPLTGNADSIRATIYGNKSNELIESVESKLGAIIAAMPSKTEEEHSPSMSAGADDSGSSGVTVSNPPVDNNVNNSGNPNINGGQVTTLPALDEWDQKKAQVEAVFANSKYYAAGKKKKASDYETKINQYLFSKNKKVLSSDGLAQLRKILGTTNDNLYNVLMDLSKMKGNILNVGGFAKGGIGRLVPAGEDGLAWVRNGEGFVRPEDVKHIQELLNVVPDVKDIIKPIDISNLQPINNNSSSIDTVQFNIEMNGVNDPKTFEKQLVASIQNGRVVQNVLQEVTVNKLNGSSSRLSVNKYR